MKLTYWSLFKTFFKIGALTIGGGYAMIPIIERELVMRKEWVEKDSFFHMISIAQSIPGIIALNSAIYLGHQLKGIKGAIVSALGVIIPAFFMILVIATFYVQSGTWPLFLEKFFIGIRLAVIALIIVSGIKLYFNTQNPFKLVIGVAALLIIYFTTFHPFVLILVIALASMIPFKVGEKR